MLEALRNYGIATHAEVIPTGLEPESFEPGDGAAFRQRHGIAAQRPVLLYVGRVAFEKNISFLLKVLVRVRQDIPDVLLVVAGEGPALSSLRHEVDRLGLSSNVLFVGYLDRRRELPGCYRSADVFVFSSHTETQGLVLLEAMAQGVPLVSLAEMGAKDVLKPGQGVLIADNDIEDFSAKAVRLLRDKEYASDLGAIGRDYAATWSAAELAHRLAGFYQAVIERHAEVPAASLDPQRS
jgi:glycosyltransferase involved in cell wall biosynthesis